MANSGDVIVINNGKLTKTGTGSNHVATVAGSLTVTENLTVNGETVTLKTATLDVEDKNITLNKADGDSSGSANGAGITIQDAVDASTDATILWDATNDEFVFSHGVDVPGIKVGGSALATTDLSGNSGARGTTITGAEGSKLANIENNATRDQSGAEIKTALFAESDTNNLTDTLLAKLNGIEASATADQTKSDIDALGIAASTAATLANTRTIAGKNFNGSADITIAAADLSDVTSAGSGAIITSDERTKLANIEANADVTDAINVANATAVMDADFGSAGFMKRGGDAGSYSVAASIGYGDLTNSDIDTDLSNVSSNHDSLASAKAIKDFVDTQVQASNEASEFTVTNGGFVNKFFDPHEAISPGQFLYPASNNKVGVADNTNASKDAVIGVAFDSASLAVTNASLQFVVMGNVSSVANGDSIEWNVSAAGNATQKYYRLVATTGDGSSTWSGDGSNGNPYLWNIKINTPGDTNTDIAGDIKTAVEHSSGGLHTNFTAGDVTDVSGGKGFSLTADNTGNAYDFTSTNKQWQTSGGQMEAEIVLNNTSSAQKVKFVIPGSSMQGFDFGTQTGGSPDYSVGMELYLNNSGGFTKTAPNSGAVIRVGYVMSVGVTDSGQPFDTFLFSPQFIMDN